MDTHKLPNVSKNCFLLTLIKNIYNNNNNNRKRNISRQALHCIVKTYSLALTDLRDVHDSNQRYTKGC